ncbi:hypothetical protein HXX01_01820 [Candidatus Nomurabacteria bacterium]|nr:hypothetical protein [Candidatus Nomurabacteria bacterium]
MVKKKIKKIIKKSSKKSPKKVKVVKVAKNEMKKTKTLLKSIKTKKAVIKKPKKPLKTKKASRKIVKKAITKKPHVVYELKLNKSTKNPILGPGLYSWESQAVFNPAAIYSGGLIHLFYRALGEDGISRIGYANSKDGINFDNRLSYPIYIAQNIEDAERHWPFTSPARRVYDRELYPSGGGWGGCEDPRTVMIDGILYMTLNIFNGWSSLRVGVISIKEDDLLKNKWNWSRLSYITKKGDRQKNWVLFPEKFDGKFAIFHNLDLGDPNRVGITFVSNLDSSESPLGSDQEVRRQILKDFQIISSPGINIHVALLALL